MSRWGDEDGLTWEEPVRIERVKGQKAVAFNENVRVKDGYKPPSGLQSFLGLPRIGLDIESWDPGIDDKGPGARRGPEGFITGVAIARNERESTYYPTRHLRQDRCIANPDAFWAQFRAEAAKFDGVVVGANLQYDLDWLDAERGIRFPLATFEDIQVAEPLLDENRFTYKLEALARDYLQEGKLKGTLSELYGKDYIKRMDRVDPGHAAEYAERDTTLPLEIIDKQRVGLANEGLENLFSIESRLTPLLLSMRRHGVRVNLDTAEQALEMTKKEVADAAAQIKDLAGFSVDVWAADSVARAFDKQSIPYPRTKGGKPSFVKEWLNAHPHPLAKMIVTQRTYEKIGGTFIENYILHGHHEGRIHCLFNQLKSDESGTVSGRFSSSSPNLQNIPARHPVLGPLCRSVFEPEEGMDWGSADWSQIEFRFLVHYAAITPGIKQLAAEAVRLYHEDKNADFHDLAATLTGKPRKVAKNINFGVVYGMGVDKMAGDLGVSREDAARILGEFHTASPFMKAIYDKASSQAEKMGMIRTILGRRRRFADFEVSFRETAKGKADRLFFPTYELAKQWVVEARGQGRYYRVYDPRRASTHKALNALLQGSAADLMKLAMVQMWEEGLFDILVPHLTIHDEMNVSVPRTLEGKQAFERMVEIMQTVLPLAVPVYAAANLGKNWDEAK